MRAHADDIEIGCGGLLLRLVQSVSRIDIDWIVFSAAAERAREARRSAALFLKGAGRTRVTLKRFRDGFFPYEGAEIKAAFERLKRGPAPDLVLTHYREDRHQDHRLLSELTWNTFRDHWILEYEIPKFDGDLGAPNCFVPLDQEICAGKAEYLQTAFGSQLDNNSPLSLRAKRSNLSADCFVARAWAPRNDRGPSARAWAPRNDRGPSAQDGLLAIDRGPSA